MTKDTDDKLARVYDLIEKSNKEINSGISQTNIEVAKISTQIDSLATKTEVAKIDTKVESLATKTEVAKIDAKVESLATKTEVLQKVSDIKDHAIRLLDRHNEVKHKQTSIVLTNRDGFVKPIKVAGTGGVIGLLAYAVYEFINFLISVHK